MVTGDRSERAQQLRIRLHRRLVITAALALALGLSACTAGWAVEADGGDVDGGVDPGPGTDDAGANAGGSDDPVVAEDSYEERLTPVALVRKATDIRVEGTDAWVTVPEASTDTTSFLVCLQLLPARMDGETLTVIFSDGVEEVCEWP